MLLKEIRDQIDQIDDQLLTLVQARRSKIGELTLLKQEDDIPVFSKEREREMLGRLLAKAQSEDIASIPLIYGVIVDTHRWYEYMHAPKEFEFPTDVGGASVRAVLSAVPGHLCRYLAPLAVADISVTNIHSKTMPGGKMVVDIELSGNTQSANFAAALSVLSETAEQFRLL